MALPAHSPMLEMLAAESAPLEPGPDALRGTSLKQLHAECLVPIGGSWGGRLQGLIALGPRLSEEPYSARDKRLLASVASQAAISMRSVSLAEGMAQRMEARRGAASRRCRLHARCKAEAAAAGGAETRDPQLQPVNAFRRAPSAATTTISWTAAPASSDSCSPTSPASAASPALLAMAEPSGQPARAVRAGARRLPSPAALGELSVLQEHRNEQLRDHVLLHLRRREPNAALPPELRP